MIGLYGWDPYLKKNNNKKNNPKKDIKRNSNPEIIFLFISKH